MYTEVIRDLDQLSSIRDDWEEIYAESLPGSVFVSFAYLLLWYKCFAKASQVRVYRVAKGGKIIGFLPLVWSHRRVIRTLESLTNDHCPHSAALVRKGYEDVFPRAALKELVRDRYTWDLLFLRFSYSFGGVPELFGDALLQEAGLKLHRHLEPTYSVFLGKSFEEYFNHDISIKVRKNLKMYKNKLAKAGSFAFLHYQGKEALKHWTKFIDIEDSGWKGKNGSSIKRLPPNFNRYYEGLLEILAAMGCLHMYFLESRGDLIAGAFCYTEYDAFHYAKIGYLERFSELSPSNLLLIHILQDLISSYPQIKRLHMFPWDHGYKHRYSNEEAYCIDTTFFGKTIRGRAVELAVHLKEKLSRS